MAEPLKNMYNRAFIDALSEAISAEYTAFDSERFHGLIFDSDWEARELKARMRHITTVLNELLPPDYPIALKILRQASERMTHFTFECMIFPDFVEMYGLDYWDDSIPAMHSFTQLVSAEFAVRPFIVHYGEKMMAQMSAWADDENHHLRRLASEGCRPRLPWAMALPLFKQDPAPILPILEKLKDDESDYVRRSVANNLNDIAKDNPHIVIEVLQRWQQDATPQREWIIKHALRTLVKQGHPEALALLGFDAAPQVEVCNFVLKNEPVMLGDKVRFSFEVCSLGSASQSLTIDYVVHHMKANGKTTPKVFKLTQKTLQPGETFTITKQHSFAPISTRRYYSGQHALEIKINGQLFAKTTFLLTLPDEI